MSKINIFLLDDLNRAKEEVNIIKPKTYKALLKQLRQNLNNLPDTFEIFILDRNYNEIKIKNGEYFDIIDDILFVREINTNNIQKSIFEFNYNILSEKNREILEEKYNCILCAISVKNEKPYLCYECQKIFHENCLKDWDKKCKLENRKLVCPNCRNELPIENWNKKLDYEDNRKDYAYLLNKIYESKLNNNMKSNVIMIKERRISKLNHYKKKQNELLQKCEKHILRTIEIFKNIIDKINSIHSLLKLKDNTKLNDLVNIYPLNFECLYYNISEGINEELDNFQDYIIKNRKYFKKKAHSKENIIKDDNINTDNTFDNKSSNDSTDSNKVRININQSKKKLNQFPIIENKKEINLTYNVLSKGNYEIFGEEFVVNNKDNIELLINGKESILVSNCDLKEGDNNITMIIKNKLINLSHMFSGCGSLQDITELKYLDVRETRDFSSMFWGCLSLSDISSLENWNVSNVNNFSFMFGGCSLLSNISALQNWNVSNGQNFGSMFWGCSILCDLTPLKNWNVSNGNDFSSMFSDCLQLSNIQPLNNWKIPRTSNVSNMFWECLSLKEVTPLQTWNDTKKQNY